MVIWLYYLPQRDLQITFYICHHYFCKVCRNRRKWDSYILFRKSLYTVWNRSQRQFCWNQMGWCLSDATTVCGHINWVQHKCHNFQNEKNNQESSYSSRTSMNSSIHFRTNFFILQDPGKLEPILAAFGGKAGDPKQFGNSLQD